MSTKIHYYSLSSTSFIEKCYIFYFFYVLVKNEESFLKKYPIKSLQLEFSSYLCNRKTELEYGVMVTLQILVLSFQVRILVLQP